MNSRQLQYAIMLAETLSFSQLAEKLEISQPALSKQILHLEEELGLQLFDRTTNPISLTPAGSHFVREAQKLIYREEQLIRSMDKYKSGEFGRLVIGISPFRCLYLVSEILKKVREKFPGIQIVLNETNSDQLRKDASEGKYDFAIVNLPVDESVLDIIPIEADELVLAVPKEISHLVGDNNSKSIDFNDCKNLPFIAVGQSQEMRRLFDKLCAASDFTPNIVAEVVGVASAWALAAEGIGATILPLQFVKSNNFDSNLKLFSIKNLKNTRQPAIVMRRGQFVSEAASYAIELLTNGNQ